MAADVVVFVGSRWAALETQATRWREVLLRWVGDPRIGSLTIVDWPRWSVRQVLGGRLVEIKEGPSWLEGVRVLDVQLPGGRRSTLLDAVGWRSAAKELVQVLPDQVDLALSTNPLWNPVLPLLGAVSTGFDAVDDWREHPMAEDIGDRIDAGYRAAREATTVTANSGRLGQPLAADYGLDPVPVLNGVDLDLFSRPAPEAPPGLPAGPFLAYVGVVQERVDLALLETLAHGSGLPVVVAGPASPEDVARLERAGVIVLGPIHHDLVPGILRRAAVGLVPHRVNEFTTSMDPMKLLEYLAAGLPVVTTPLPGVAELSARVFVADGPSEFVEAARRAAALPRLREPDPAVRARDWAVVATRLLDLHLPAGA